MSLPKKSVRLDNYDLWNVEEALQKRINELSEMIACYESLPAASTDVEYLAYLGGRQGDCEKAWERIHTTRILERGH